MATPDACGEQLEGGALFQVMWHESPECGHLSGAKENGTVGRSVCFPPYSNIDISCTCSKKNERQ